MSGSSFPLVAGVLLDSGKKKQTNHKYIYTNFLESKLDNQQKQKKEKTGATGKGRLTREPIDKCILEKKIKKQTINVTFIIISIKSCVKEDLRSVPTIKQGKAV